MSHNLWFEFKQFKILQEKSAMRVNTDGVLLGAWASLNGIKTVLDVGTGTGLISLMVAQRCDAVIIGVEIEKQAADEAIQNVQNSKWGNRITIQHCSFQQFAESTSGHFDLIITNPPFFSNGIKNKNPQLSVARHNDQLPFNDLIGGSKKLLSENGILSVIMPSISAPQFIAASQQKALYLKRFTEVKPFPGKEPNRCLMEFGKMQIILNKDQLSVFDESGTAYSKEFRLLAKDFYLKL